MDYPDRGTSFSWLALLLVGKCTCSLFSVFHYKNLEDVFPKIACVKNWLCSKCAQKFVFIFFRIVPT
jgi:hypothetical protein